MRKGIFWCKDSDAEAVELIIISVPSNATAMEILKHKQFSAQNPEKTLITKQSGST